MKPIKTEADHAAALREIERLWGAEEGTPNGDRLDVLSTLVEAYEEAHFPIDMPDLIEAIKFRLEQQGEDKNALSWESLEVEPVISTENTQLTETENA